jgi:Predicted metal-binding integral membrane protein (DUF2182)
MPSAIETIMAQDRRVVATALGVVTVAAWAYTLAMRGGGMDDMAMDGTMSSLLLTPAHWGVGHAAAMLLMWWVMMAAMMLPSAAPLILLYAAVQRKQREAINPFVPTGVLVAGYLAVWGAFGAGATLLQRGPRAERAARHVDVPDEPAARSRAAGGGGPLPVHASQGGLPPPLPVAPGLRPRPVAPGRGRRLPDGAGARGLLPRLLLGAHGPALRGRGDEPALDRGSRALRAGRKAPAAGAFGPLSVRQASRRMGLGIAVGAL